MHDFLMASVVPHCECAGCVLGLLGAFLLATNTRFSPLGWISFLAANVAMITFAYGVGAHWLLWQQVGFTATSCLGLWRSRSRLPGALGLPGKGAAL
jgi:hypothetical protein